MQLFYKRDRVLDTRNSNTRAKLSIKCTLYRYVYICRVHYSPNEKHEHMAYLDYIIKIVISKKLHSALFKHYHDIHTLSFSYFPVKFYLLILQMISYPHYHLSAMI